MSETTELAQQVADLTTSTTNLTNTVVGQVERLSADVAITDQKATEAANSAIAAEDSAVAANTHKAQAKVEADRAKSEADNAASVVTGGTATLDSEAGKIPLADSDGKIDLSWLPAEAQGYNVFAQEQAVNNDKFAASGFVHFGKHYASGDSINEGMSSVVSTTYANKLMIGRDIDSMAGNSKTKHPVMNIAGVETIFEGMFNSPYNQWGYIKFPEAPNGTVTYDSATGAIMDYTKDIDPKYGDVAPDVNEAVARAFEGDIKNGDFRFGDDGSWYITDISGSTANLDVIGGVMQFTTATDGTGNYQFKSLSLTSNYVGEVEILINCPNITIPLSVVAHTGAGYSIIGELTQGNNRFVFNKTTSGSGAPLIYLQTSSRTGAVVEFANISYRPVTTEVVTERVDMWGFEAWLEEVSQANPYVYQNGLIQSQATDIDGVSTGSSNRPDTYYAVFDGDTTSRGNGVNFWAISDAQRKAIFSNPDNKLYPINGKIYQSRLRQRTIAGAGNGDWGSIDSNGTEDLLFEGAQTRVTPQGIEGAVPPYAVGTPYIPARSSSDRIHSGSDKGIYYLRDVVANNNKGAFGHCYFLVCGTVSRLNQGAYHPSFNAMGTGNGYNSTVGSHADWDSSAARGHYTSIRSCFSFGSNYLPRGDAFELSPARGSISSEVVRNGRPDGRFYDAIYADGLGGVVLDMRYSAWDKSAPEHKAKALAMVENGTYRGVEKLKFTKVLPTTEIRSGLVGDFAVVPNQPRAKLVDNGTNFLTTVIADALLGTTIQINGQGYTITEISAAVGNSAEFYVDRPIDLTGASFVGSTSGWSVYTGVCNTFYSSYKNYSVGGEFQLTEVIGDPANILANPDLKEGWLGVWNPTIPVSSTLIPLSRKALGASADVVYTSDNGVAWGTTSVTLDGVNNTGSTWSAPSTAVYDYTIFAKQTKPSTNQSVFNGEAGVGSVFASMSPQVYDGVLLGESLYGGVAPATWANSTLIPLNKFDISGVDGELYEGVDNMKSITHLLIDFAGYTDACMLKTLTTQLNVNDQASIQFQYEELVHNGTDWGDDGKMVITTTGDSTNTDENGTVVKCGVHELAVPYGWCKVEV